MQDNDRTMNQDKIRCETDIPCIKWSFNRHKIVLRYLIFLLPDSESSGDSGSGHRGSLRGANKLARRARSFKDDLLERISNLRSPQQHAPHLASALRYL